LLETDLNKVIEIANILAQDIGTKYELNRFENYDFIL